MSSEKIAGSHEIVKLAEAIIIGALVSMFGINLVGSFGAPRLWIALSDVEILPARLSAKNRFGVPTAAFALTAALASRSRSHCVSTTAISPVWP